MDTGDEERLRAALVGDLDAGFAELVRTHGDVVHSVARNLAPRPADAEDLAADALLRAYRALRGFDATRIGSLSVRPWLLTILRNAARNAVRDAGRRPGPPPAFDPVDEPDAAAGPADLAERAATGRELGAALAGLPEVQRTAVVLRHVVGLATGEVAAVLGCKEGTAKSHISRGLARLRSLLAGERAPATAGGTPVTTGRPGPRADHPPTPDQPVIAARHTAAPAGHRVDHAPAPSRGGAH